jgi:putative PIG3 family NAD(P)H quinone oxidoreductase
MSEVARAMLAVEITEFGGPDVLRLVERVLPRPGPDEVLVRVEAAGVNRPDVMQRMGKYPPPPGASDLPGLEVAGTVAACGDAVARWHEGDAVCGLVAGGGYAEYCVVPAPQCLPIPEGMSAVAAAAIPETFFTVWTNLFQRAHMRAGERVLVHGGTSGIGTTAIQLARAFGATVYATAGSDEKCDACVRLGATWAINYSAADFVAAVKDATGGRGVDIVLDIIGGEYLTRNISSLALHGRLVQIGLIGGARAQIDLRPVLQNRLTITGSTLRVRTVEEKGAIARELEEQVWPRFASGEIAPVIHRTFELKDAADAHRLIEAGTHIGKIVLTVPERRR